MRLLEARAMLAQRAGGGGGEGGSVGGWRRAQPERHPPALRRPGEEGREKMGNASAHHGEVFGVPRSTAFCVNEKV